MARGSDEAFSACYARAQIDPVLGDRAFKAHVLTGHRPQVDLPELNAVRVRATLAHMVSVTRRYYGVAPAQSRISTRGRGGHHPRAGRGDGSLPTDGRHAPGSDR